MDPVPKAPRTAPACVSLQMGTQTRSGRLSAPVPVPVPVPGMTWRERIMQYIDATERTPRSPSPTIITTSSPSAVSASDTSRQRAVASNAAANADADYGTALPTFESEGGKKSGSSKPISVVYRRNLAWMIMAALGLVTMLAMYRRTLAHQYHQHQRFEGAAPTMTSYVDPEPTTPRQIELQALANQLEALKEPEERRSTNGELNTTLRVIAKHFTNGPISFWTRSYEDSIPGPTLRIQPGDTLNILLVNELTGDEPGPWTLNTLHNPNTTNLHVHGMHVDPTGIADNVMRVVKPGETAFTQVHVPKDHPRGVFHYHPHYHGSVFVQMGGGMVGAIVVEDDPETLPAEYEAMQQHVLVLQDFRFLGGLASSLSDAARAARSKIDMKLTYTKRGVETDANVRKLFPRVHRKHPTLDLPLEAELDAATMNDADHPNRTPPVSEYHTVNGQYMPKIEIRPYENRLLRLLNAGGTSVLELSVPGCSLRLIASDGIYMKAPRPIRSLLLSPGSRSDVVINCEPNSATARNLEFLRPLQAVQDPATGAFVGRGADVFEGVLAFFHVTGSPLPMPLVTSTPPPPALYGGDDLLTLSAEDKAAMDPKPFEFVFSMGGATTKDGFSYKNYFINHKLFDGKSLHTMKLGVVQEWVIVNDRDEFGKKTSKNHPFHMHTNSFQIVAMSHGAGIDYEVGDWRDVIEVPTPGNVTIRFRPVDYRATVFAHCHILGHSDAGMVSVVDIV